MRESMKKMLLQLKKLRSNDKSPVAKQVFRPEGSIESIRAARTRTPWK